MAEYSQLYATEFGRGTQDESAAGGVAADNHEAPAAVFSRGVRGHPADFFAAANAQVNRVQNAAKILSEALFGGKRSLAVSPDDAVDRYGQLLNALCGKCLFRFTNPFEQFIRLIWYRISEPIPKYFSM